MFEERLGSYRVDIFAIKAVMAVGVSPYFYGFSMESNYFGLYYVFALQDGLLK